MKIHDKILYCLLIIIPLTKLDAQIAIPKGYFASPLNIPLSMTGAFSEVRDNHFHSGIDFQVQKKEGLPVFAVADGVISRIKVSPVGFGNALYIDHPNGFTSVYAHLKGYNDTITGYLRKNQYRLHSFDVDLFPLNKKEFIFVKKGDLIGYAGNSGSSGGAHLHFEIRNTKTEHIINPLLVDLKVQDNYPPYIDFIKIYPDDLNSFIGTSNSATRFNVKRTGTSEYRLATKDTIAVWGSFSIGVQAFDYNQNQSDRNGFYRLEIFADKSGLFSMECDSFAFSESRYVNATIDYAANYNSGYRIVKSKKLPGNELSFFKSDAAGGVVKCTDNKIHEILITVSDVVGNKANLRFWIKSQPPDGFVQVPYLTDADTTLLFRYNKVNVFETSELKVELPVGSLYEDVLFRYRKTPGTAGMFSEIHYLHDPEVPIHSRIKVAVKPKNLPQRLRSKALLVRIDRDGKRSAAGGSYENGFVTATTNLFDGYAIVIDTVPPVIKPWSENRSSTTGLRFTVSDNFSGIKVYKGEVNGQWVLVEWDPKNKLMIYRYDNIAQPGKNNFKLTLEDDKGNTSTYSTTFTR